MIKLIGRLKNEIKLNDEVTLDVLIDKLVSLHNLNPTKDFKVSMLTSETFLSLFTEGEIYSRRNIKRLFDDKKALSEEQETKMVTNFIDAYKFVLKGQKFSTSNLFTLYNLLSQGAISEDDCLLDGHMFRHEAVYIGNNKQTDDFTGFESEDILTALNHLFTLLNDDSINIYKRAIIGHIYFEMIHPYFDYNGRTGRFIPMWLFSNNGIKKDMMYFATAVGNYRDQYLALFRKNIDTRTYEVNLDKMVQGVTKLLILNQYQYIHLKKLENLYIDKSKKSFTSLQKDFIWMLMIKIENSQAANNSWFKLTNKDKDFVETNLRQATFSKDTNALKEFGIIDISSDKPRKYKLLDYNLLSVDLIK